MKRILLLAIIPALLLSCQNQKEKDTKKEEQTKNEEKASDVQASTLTEHGQQVPQFSFSTLEGNEYSMKKLEGKVVLLNFFATWCPTCMKEMPALEEQVWKQYRDNEEFFMVSIGREHTMDEMEKFQKEKGYSFNFAPDTGRVIYGQFAEKYIPRNIVVDRNGKIIYQCAGYKEEDFQEMLGIIEKEL